MRRLIDGVAGAWNGFFFHGYSLRSLSALRIAIGLGFLPFQLTQLFPFFELSARPSWYFLERVWYFRFFGIERLDPVVCWALLAVWLVANATMIVGFFTRTSIAVVLATSVFLTGARDSVVGDTHHRLYLWAMVLGFLLLSDCGKAYALDARSSARGAEESVPEWQASWPIRAMQLYVATFYFWSAVAKLRVSGIDWLAGGGKLQEILLRRSAMWGLDENGHALGNELAFRMAHNPPLLEALAGCVLLMEAMFPILLFVRSTRVRLAVLAVVVAFHVANFALLYVGFVLIPLVFVVFFDMEDVAARIRPHLRRLRRTGRGTGSTSVHGT